MLAWQVVRLHNGHFVTIPCQQSSTAQPCNMGEKLQKGQGLPRMTSPSQVETPFTTPSLPLVLTE